jgi:hypothetical protein
VLAVHEDEGSRGTGGAQTWCPRRGETAPLQPGVQVECLRSPMISPASSLFPFPVQVLPILVAPSCARLVVCRREQRTTDQLRPFPAQTETARRAESPMQQEAPAARGGRPSAQGRGQGASGSVGLLSL